MLDWIVENKEWLFSGVAVAVLAAGIGLFWPDHSSQPSSTDNSIHQTHSGSDDNVGRDKNITTDNSVRQFSIGGDNVAGDKIVNQLLSQSVDYQQLVANIKDAEELLAGIAPEKTSLRLKQSAKLEELRKRLESFKQDVFRLHEQFTRIPIDNERLRKAKAHFDKGEFREADAVLKAEEIERDVERLKLEEHAAKDRLAAVRKDLEGRANEFLLKAQLSLINPLEEGEDRFRRTEGYFEQALAAARTAEVLHEYAFFLYEHNAFSKAEPMYQAALQRCRIDAKTDPEKNLPYVATTLNNLAVLHAKAKDYGAALKEFEETLKLYRSLVETEPKAFLPYVAATLHNLANLHASIREHSSALKEYEEALKLYRSFAEIEPKAFLPYVAATLNSFATLHAATQEYGPALKEYEEALKIGRSLAETEPKAFLPDVAATLHNLALLHAVIRKYDLSLKEYEEALKIRRNFAKDEPKVFLPDVAMTLSNLAALHAATQAYGPALKEFEEALKIRRSLAETEPKAFLPYVAETLINLSIFHLQAAPDRAKSVAYAQEARSILIPLCKQAPHLQRYLDKAEALLKANNAASA